MKKYKICLLFWVFTANLFGQMPIDSQQIMQNLEILSSDAYEGRGTGQVGISKSRDFLVNAFDRLGFEMLDSTYRYPFGFLDRVFRNKMDGENIVGLIRGTQYPNQYLVLTAHYDHLGIFNEQIYNGADDNASGTCALLAIGAYFVKHPPKHSILIVAFDAEEKGLVGSDRFVDEPPVPKDAILLNINMDMISRNAKNELYICGTHHYPFLKAPINRLLKATPINVLFGHDDPNNYQVENWTSASDHGSFHQAKIPFLYFGVEDHPDYHKHTDDFDKIKPDFYISAVSFIGATLLSLDEEWELLKDSKK